MGPIQLTWKLQRGGDCSWAKEEAQVVERQLLDTAYALLAAGVACLALAAILGCLSRGTYRLWWWSRRRQDLALVAETSSRRETGRPSLARPAITMDSVVP